MTESDGHHGEIDGQDAEADERVSDLLVPIVPPHDWCGEWGCDCRWRTDVR